MQEKTSLHTLNKTNSHQTLNKRLSDVIGEYDEVILIEDGAYQCLTLNTIRDQETHWSSIAKTIYVLSDDAVARGIATSLADYTFISYEEFVALSLKHHKVISWY